VPDLFDETRHTAEIDVQHGVLRGRHDLVGGGAFRVTHARDTGAGILSFTPVERTDAILSAFVQDEITLSRDSTYLTIGSKFERNDFTGIEVQPTARFRWDLGDGETVWAAVSRAVRLPSRFDTDLGIASPALVIQGSEAFEAEEVVAYEAGYRAVPHERLSVDAAVFANRYDRLRSQEQPLSPGGPVVLGNTLNAVTRGIELSARLQVLEGWRLSGSYAYLDKDLSFDAGSRDITGGAAEGNDPRHRLSLWARVDLPRSLELDGMFRYVGHRPGPAVPAYAELDVRVGWMLRPTVEVSVVGQNLLHDRHREFGAAGPNAVLLTRGAYVRTLWRF
jgi:iron complex outermembrane receptor protein